MQNKVSITPETQSLETLLHQCLEMFVSLDLTVHLDGLRQCILFWSLLAVFFLKNLVRSVYMSGPLQLNVSITVKIINPDNATFAKKLRYTMHSHKTEDTSQKLRLVQPAIDSKEIASRQNLIS